MTIFDYFGAFFQNFKKWYFFGFKWVFVGLKKRVEIKNRLPDPFFSKRTKKGKKGTIY